MQKAPDKTPGQSPRKKYRLLDFSVYIPKNLGALKTMTRSLRYRDFLLYLAGMFIVNIGVWIQQVATGWLVFRITDSLAQLSTAVFLSQIPILFIEPFAGVLSVSVEQSFWGRIFRYGNVKVDAVGRWDVDMNDVVNPAGLKTYLESRIVPADRLSQTIIN